MTPRYPGRVRSANSIRTCRRFSSKYRIVSSCPIMRRNMWRMSRSGRETRCGPKSEGDLVVVGIAPSFIWIRLPWLAVHGDDVIGVDFGGGALGPVPVLPLAMAQRPLDEGAAALVKNFRELRRGLFP